MSTRLVNLVIDAADPRRLAAFWAGLLGWRIALTGPGVVVVRAPAGDGWDLDVCFVPVREPKTGRNRIHLDLASATARAQAERVAAARELGGRPLDIGQGDVPWEVLADPEGNEFCVLEPRPIYQNCGAVAAVVIGAAGPERLASFWAEATGWRPARTSAPFPALRAPTGVGPWLEFVPAGEPEAVKNRLHLDVAPPPGGDHDHAAEWLIGLGARRADVGQGGAPWHVLADPEGNEFCVLGPRDHPPR
ncbi:VOC family protein [Spongiactinospora sp. 9N601]|uniref:VOC family protein n=1 Tax=Spongiactinospora sp. 9N601 TaxID=3375149 RepID=UPI0037B5CEA3